MRKITQMFSYKNFVIRIWMTEGIPDKVFGSIKNNFCSQIDFIDTNYIGILRKFEKYIDDYFRSTK